MPGAFNPEESYNNSILLQKLEAEAEPPVEKVVEKLATNLEKMALETNLRLNLSEQPTSFSTCQSNVYSTILLGFVTPWLTPPMNYESFVCWPS